MSLELSINNAGIPPNEFFPTPSLVDLQVVWNPIPATFYTLAIYDVDAPGSTADTPYLHLLVINIPGMDILSGNPLAEWLLPYPPPGSGLHRYVVNLYQQSDRIFDFPIRNRSQYPLLNFVRQHGLVSVASRIFVADPDTNTFYLQSSRPTSSFPTSTSFQKRVSFEEFSPPRTLFSSRSSSPISQSPSLIPSPPRSYSPPSLVSPRSPSVMMPRSPLPDPSFAPYTPIFTGGNPAHPKIRADSSLSDSQIKYCSCVVDVAAKNSDECNAGGKNMWGSEKCYNPYAVCAKSTHGSSKHCVDQYNFAAFTNQQLISLAYAHGIILGPSDTRESTIAKLMTK